MLLSNNWKVRLIFVVVALSVLMGCETVQTKVVTKTVYVTPDVRPSFLKPVVLVPPPNPKAYRAMSVSEREDALTRYTLTTISLVEQGNQDKVAVQKDLDAQKATLATPTQEPLDGK